MELRLPKLSSIVFMMPPQIPDTVPPVLRGYLHLAAAIVAPFALIPLLSAADSPREVVGGAVFGASLIALYWTSATFHLVPFGHRLRDMIRRLDHAVIFVFIAGAYTPFALTLMGDEWGVPVLAVVGGLAGVGVIATLTAPALPRWIRVGLYLAIGWVGIVAVSELLTTLPWKAFAMLVSSGILFSLAGATYGARRPDPFPRVFGYHEMFHALQIAATVVLYLVVLVYGLH